MQEKHPIGPVKSDETLIAILKVVKNRGTVRVGEVADELDIAKSTAHNHLATLNHHDFIYRTKEGFSLGLRFLDYGHSARQNWPLYEASREKVDELAEKTGERVWAVVEEHGDAVFVYGSSGSHSIQTKESIGERRPLHCLAAGKAILAHLPKERVEEIIECRGLEPRTQNTITNLDELFKELETVREQGVAFNMQESMEGIHVIGAPVLDTDGTVYGAMSIGGPANRLTTDRLQNNISDLILGAANEIEINLRNQ